MNYVYKLIFDDRKQNNDEPYYYIGSKSNSTYVDGILLDNKNKVYYGSSSLENWNEIVENNKISVEIIKEFEDYNDALNYESMLQKSLDIVADTKYFNLSIATVNNFTDPNYASYKHTRTGKTVRLARTHPMVLSGEYVGVSKGTKLSEETRKKMGRSGAQNAFYGKCHSEETKRKIGKINSERIKTQEEIDNWVEKVSSKPKSIEHRKKIGRKNLIMLKNKITGECIRIDKDTASDYDRIVWVNPAALSENSSKGSKWINDGVNNKKLLPNQNMPIGWNFGRIYKNWNDRKGNKYENNTN